MLYTSALFCLSIQAAVLDLSEAAVNTSQMPSSPTSWRPARGIDTPSPSLPWTGSQHRLFDLSNISPNSHVSLQSSILPSPLPMPHMTIPSRLVLQKTNPLLVSYHLLFYSSHFLSILSKLVPDCTCFHLKRFNGFPLLLSKAQDTPMIASLAGTELALLLLSSSHSAFSFH